jgi:hypothetical protein
MIVLLEEMEVGPWENQALLAHHREVVVAAEVEAELKTWKGAPASKHLGAEGRAEDLNPTCV